MQTESYFGHRNVKLLGVAKYLVLIILLVISLFPIYIVVSTSLKHEVQTFSIPPVWLFFPTLDNYKHVFIVENFSKYLLNSLVISIGSTIITLIVGALAAYAITRFKMLGKSIFTTFNLILRMIAPAILVVPLWMLWTNLGLVHKRIGVILVYTALNLPFTIWVLTSFINQIPVELDEMAMIEGCGPLRIFLRIILPLILPGLGAASIFCFRISWNEFLLSFVLTNQHTRTLPAAISLQLTTHGVNWGSLTAMGTIIALPALLFCFIAGAGLIQGLTGGAVKS